MTKLAERNFEVAVDAISLAGLVDVDLEKMERACAILGACNLKLVPEDVVHLPGDFASAIFVLAKDHLRGLTVEKIARAGEQA
jgi:hypothetical protein